MYSTLCSRTHGALHGVSFPGRDQGRQAASPSLLLPWPSPPCCRPNSISGQQSRRLHSVPSPLFSPCAQKLFGPTSARSTSMAPSSSTPCLWLPALAPLLPHCAAALRSTFHGRPEIPTASPFLAVRHGARRLFDKMRSKPRAAAALPFDLHSPRRVSSLSCSLRSPLRDAVENRGEKPSLPLLLLYFYFWAR
jgi:hypothetical protein|uniref:Uncharacterized protein n=1 Tax=Zea mays TaxID=4577 RepID=A0A804PJU9_MAIZE